MAERKSEIPVAKHIRDKLRDAKGDNTTWDDYLDLLYKTSEDMKKRSKFEGW